MAWVDSFTAIGPWLPVTSSVVRNVAPSIRVCVESAPLLTYTLLVAVFTATYCGRSLTATFVVASVVPSITVTLLESSLAT